MEKINNPVRIPFQCEMLVDQGKYIGKDPVGYRCNTSAVWKAPAGYLLCERCKGLLDSAPDRLTLPRPPFGTAYQQEMLAQALERAK